LVNRIYSYFVTLGDIEEGRVEKVERVKKVTEDLKISKTLIAGLVSILFFDLKRRFPDGF
jgi:hypothetical protein